MRFKISVLFASCAISAGGSGGACCGGVLVQPTPFEIFWHYFITIEKCHFDPSKSNGTSVVIDVYCSPAN